MAMSEEERPPDDICETLYDHIQHVKHVLKIGGVATSPTHKLTILQISKDIFIVKFPGADAEEVDPIDLADPLSMD